ncbi:hypothetical protein GGF32_005244 [Allomyces javanicus]|nr:hypothetical protein GGF32_005244 [Allomyces javanicus]
MPDDLPDLVKLSLLPLKKQGELHAAHPGLLAELKAELGKDDNPAVPLPPKRVLGAANARNRETPNAGAAQPAHTLRPYQNECIEKSLEALAEGVTRQAVSLPVGAGKTVVFSNLITRVPNPTPRAKRTLVLAHRKELLDQATNQIARAAPGLVILKEGGGVKKEPAVETGDVIVASVAALGKTGTTRLLKYDPADFKLIIIDEAHHAAATTYLRILEHFGLRDPEKPSHILLWGCSATLHRMDGLSLGTVFDKITYQRGFLEMIKEGYLCDFLLQIIETTTDLGHVKSSQGDYAVGELSRTVNQTSRNDLIVRSWLQVSSYDRTTDQATKRRSTLVFATDIEHVEGLADAFCKTGAEAHALHSKISPELRDSLIQRFRRGEFPVLINCGILTEGTDIPNIDCIILARPTRSSVLYQQMLGRGLRLHSDKTECLVIDVVDQNTKADLVTAPSLLGLNPHFAPGDEGMVFTKLAEKAQELHKADLGEEATSARTYEEMVALLSGEGPEGGETVVDYLDRLINEGEVELKTVGTAEDVAKASIGEGQYLAQLDRGFASQYDWFFLRRGALGLKLPNNALLRIDVEPRSFTVTKQQTITTSDGAKIKKKWDMTKLIPGLPTIQQVVLACDHWVKNEFPTTHFRSTRRVAAKCGLRSDAQVRFLKQLGFLSLPDGKSQVDVDGKDLATRREEELATMNLNRAMKYITRLTEGMGKVVRKEATKKEKARATAKARVKEHGIL